MNNIFKITGKDKREELLQALKDDVPFTAQAMGGKGIEEFDVNYGFVLLEKNKTYPPTNTALLRTKAAIEIYNLLGRSSLRTGYYTCRQKPEFAQYFEGTNNFNNVWLDTISRQLEILCDIDRDVLTFGTPDGVLFYPHSRKFGSKETMIALSEDIATQHLKDDEISHCMNILVDEKMSNALELIGDKHDFLRMLNMMCATRGGRFNRAILKLINRFDTQKNVLLWTDGDTFGVDIRAVAVRGSKNLRHQTLTQTSKKAFDVGLFPSVAEMLNVPVDIDEKKPMSGDEKTGSRKLVEHLKNAGLHPDDLQTFYNDHTYEIEGLHTKFTDRNGKPIGTQIYLTEYLRLMKLDCKPQPSSDDDLLREELFFALQDIVTNEIQIQLKNQIQLTVDTGAIDNAIEGFLDKTITNILLQKNAEMHQLVDKISADDIRDKVNNWYVGHPMREIYNIADIAKEMVGDILINMEVDFSDLQNKINSIIAEFAIIAKAELNAAEIDTQIQIEEFKKVEKVMDYYDLVLKRLGAKKEDVLAIRKALERRLRIE